MADQTLRMIAELVNRVAWQRPWRAICQQLDKRIGKDIGKDKFLGSPPGCRRSGVARPSAVPRKFF